MAQTIKATFKAKHGPESTIPTLDEAVFGYTTDSSKVYIGSSSSGNIQLAKQSDLDAANSNIASKANQSDLNAANTNIGQKADKSYVDSQDALKLDKTSIVDNLTSTDSMVPLSANQGQVLKGLVDGNTVSLAQKATQANLRKFKPLWGINIYIDSDLNAMKANVDIASSLNMEAVLLCTNFQDLGNSFYNAYDYVNAYNNIPAICDYIVSKGMTVKAIKIHEYNLNHAAVDFQTKYIAGINTLLPYINSATNKPNTIMVLNEVNDMVYAYATWGTFMNNVINTIKTAGYKAGIPFSSSFQYVTVCNFNVMNNLDVIGINFYPKITGNVNNVDVIDGINAWNKSGFDNVAKMLKIAYPNAELWMSETGIYDNMNALLEPGTSWQQGYTATGNGKPSEIYFTGMFEYLKDSTIVKGVYGWWPSSLNTVNLQTVSAKYIKGVL